MMVSFHCNQKAKQPREERGLHIVTESDARTRASGPVIFILLPFWVPNFQLGALICLCWEK